MIYTGQHKQDKWLIEEYFKFKTINIYIHKDALSSELKGKLKL